MELGDQPVLEGAPDPFYAAFRLGCVGQGEPDAQLLQGPAQLCVVTPASQLLLQAIRLFGGALEDAMPVAV